MKMVLPRIPEGSVFGSSSISMIIQGYMQLNGITLDSRDLEVGYNDVYDFYDVSLYRWSRCTPGCGTRKYRDKLWVETIRVFESIADIISTPKMVW